MHSEAGNHGAPGTLKGIETVSVDLISQSHDAEADIGTDSNPPADGVGQQCCQKVQTFRDKSNGLFRASSEALLEQRRWIAEGFGEIGEEQSGLCAVDDAMVAG